MKKNLVTSALLALTLITAAAPLQAQDKDALKAKRSRFKESTDRLYRCARGKCTRAELMKASRDVVVTAAALTALAAAVYFRRKYKARIGELGEGLRERYLDIRYPSPVGTPFERPVGTP